MGRLWNIVFIDIVVILYVATEAVSTEPCNDYQEITENERAANLQLDLGSTNPFTDDRLNNGWYRVVNDVGEEMATSPPGTFNCTTWYPIWLNGSLPSTINTTVTAPVCLQTFHSLCKHTWNIDIKRCPGNYLVYNLKTSPLIDSGYCFGWAVPCPAGQTGWSPNCKNVTTTSSTTVRSTTRPSTTASSTMANPTTTRRSTMVSSTSSSLPTVSSTTRRSTTVSSTTASSATVSQTMIRSTTASSTTASSTTTAQNNVNSSKWKEDDSGSSVLVIVCAVIIVIFVCLLLFVVVKYRMIQKSDKRKHLYEETAKYFKSDKENEHIYSIPESDKYPDDSPPPYSSRRQSTCSGIINSNGLNVEPQSPPVYLFTVDKK